jgi:hypothetical protein
MSTVASKPWFDVRIPQLLLDQLKAGAVTVSMFLAMTLLYRWSDWRTGVVQHASAGGLHTATARAFSVRTFQSAMKRLEAMGWITRHIVKGSHKDFTVTIHNYKWIDVKGKVRIINPSPNDELALSTAGKPAVKKNGETTVKKDSSKECGHDACGEACGEECGETSDKILSLNESEYEEYLSSLPSGSDMSEDDYFRWCIEREFEDAIRNILPELTDFISNLQFHPTSITEIDAAKAFSGVNEALFEGAGRLFANTRGSSSTCLDYEDIWRLDEGYGTGTSEALARKISKLIPLDDSRSHSTRRFAWGRSSGQLIARLP